MSKIPSRQAGVLVTLLVAVLCGTVTIGAQADKPKAVPSPELQKGFADYLAAHTESPEDYVVGKFKDHDIVFLGEQHHIQQNFDFVQRVIPRLHAAGIDNLGFEFVNSEDQPALDRLVNAPAWDQAAAEQVLWKCYNLGMVSTGYVGVLHAAWQVNHGLKPGAHRFRVVALNIQSRVTSRSQLRPGEVATDFKVRCRVLGLNLFDVANFHWARVISDQFIAKGEKALIYAGSGHTWTRFFFQRQIDSGLTVGNLIYNYIGERTLRLVLHGDLQGGKPFEELVESLMSGYDAGRRQAAFDVRGGPLGEIPMKTRGYLYAGKPDHRLIAGDLWDGYIYLGSTKDWRNDTFIASFITPQNYARLKGSWELFSRAEKTNSLEELVRVVRKDAEWLSEGK
jgi:hypothetical protein